MLFDQLIERNGCFCSALNLGLLALGRDFKFFIKLAMEETDFDFANRRRRVLSDKLSKLTIKNVLMIWNIETVYESTLTGQLMMQGITEALHTIGSNLMVDHIYGVEKAPPFLKSGQLDGVFFHGSSPSTAIYNKLRKHPMVWLLKLGSFEFGDRVKPDHPLAGEISCDWLVQQGCRNLCCMSYTVTGSHFANARADRFLSRAKEMRVKSGLLVEAIPSYSAKLQADQTTIASNLVEQFIHLDPRPDGLFVANELGPYIHTELMTRGIVPMKDLPVIAGGEDICAGHHLDPMPATIRIFSPQIGRQAIETLLQRIKNPDMPQVTCSLKPELVIPK